MLNSETVYPANYTLLGSQKHITLNMRLRECPPPPPWDTQGYFVQLASTACGERAWSEQRLKCNSTKKNCGKLIKISITFFFFKNSIIYGHIREYPGPRGFSWNFSFSLSPCHFAARSPFPKKKISRKTPGTRVIQELLMEGEAKIDQPTETVLHSNLNSSHYLS